jgi:RNA polymerase sigma-70 factor (ECF subfamily)
MADEPNAIREREWVAAAQRGDHEAFRQIVELYQDRLFTFLLRMVRQHEEAEDLAQEAFVRAWRHLDAYDARWTFRTWLFSIARHLALNALRRPRAIIISIEGGGDPAHPGLALASADSSPAEQAAVREQRRRLARALDDLTPRAAMIFTLFYQEAMSIAEIAQTVGMTAGAVKVALHRARETLKSKMKNEQ